MRRICCFLLVLCLLCAAQPGALAYESREELRAAYRAIGASIDVSPYAEQPKVTAPHSAGALSEYAANDALAGWDPTGGCLYYYNPSTATSAWIWTREVRLNIGAHAFAV